MLQRAFLTGTMLCAASLYVLFFSAQPVFAQSIGINPAIELDTNPDDPLPNSPVTVEIAASTLNMNGTSIRWYVDGEEAASARDARSMTFDMGPLGSGLTVRAVVTPSNGGSISAEKKLRASQVDLILEADTRVPGFYQGRALPVAGETVRVTAVPHMAGFNDPSALTYTWKLNNKIQLGGPVKGASQFAFAAPQTAALLSVAVFDPAGGRLGGATMNISPAAPELHFYEDNPLRSMSRQAIPHERTFTLVGDEVTVRAEPYFVSSDIFSSNPELTWTLDGKTIQNFGGDVQALTLRGEGGVGESRIGFKLINPHALLQYVNESFTIHFE